MIEQRQCQANYARPTPLGDRRPPAPRQRPDLRQSRQGKPRQSYGKAYQQSAEAFGAEPTLTRASPNRLFESLKLCSTQPLCQYQEAALFAFFRLVAKYQGSSGCLRLGFLARLLGTLQHKATLIMRSRGRPW